LDEEENEIRRWILKRGKTSRVPLVIAIECLVLMPFNTYPIYEKARSGAEAAKECNPAVETRL
jgi:hypothetical protein